MPSRLDCRWPLAIIVGAFCLSGAAIAQTRASPPSGQRLSMGSADAVAPKAQTAAAAPGGGNDLPYVYSALSTDDPAKWPFRPGSDGPYATAPEVENPLLAPQIVPVDAPGRMPGFFSSVELQIVKPHLKSTLNTGTALTVKNSQLQSPGDTVLADLVVVPSGVLDWTGAPTIYAGYRLDHGYGDVRIGYRNVASDGSVNISDFDLAGAGSVRTRLNLNIIDFDYASAEWLVNQTPGLLRDLKFVIGPRLAFVYFDQRGAGNQILFQRATDSTFGFGAHTAVIFSHPIGGTSFDLYSRIDAASYIGRIRQRFIENEILPDGATVSADAPGRTESTGFSQLTYDVGLAWTPPTDKRFRLFAGYHLERFWKLGAADNSNAELTIQGLMFQGEWNY